RSEQLFIFEAMERGIKGSLLDLERVARDLLDSLCDGIAVNGSKRNDPHDEKVERALRKVKFVVCLLHAYCFYIYIARCRRSKYIRRIHARRPDLPGLKTRLVKLLNVGLIFVFQATTANSVNE